MKNITTTYPALSVLQALFQDPAGAWKRLHRATSFRELIVHYALPFYLITLLGAMAYYMLTAKSPLHAITKGGSGPLLFWIVFTLFLRITGQAISAGASHFGFKNREITSHNLVVFSLLPAIALAPLYFLGIPGKLVVLTGILYSLILIYYGSKYLFKAPPEVEKTWIISIYSFVIFFSLIFFGGYLAVVYFLF